MAYLHCHNCDWSQDDFWSEEGWSPFAKGNMQSMKEYLFKDTVTFGADSHIKEVFPTGELVDGHWVVDSREYVAHELERTARSIRNMAVKTNEDWEKVKDTWKCPKCGSNDWDID